MKKQIEKFISKSSAVKLSHAVHKQVIPSEKRQSATVESSGNNALALGNQVKNIKRFGSTSSSRNSGIIGS